MAFNEVINLNTGLQSQAHALDFIFFINKIIFVFLKKTYDTLSIMIDDVSLHG